MFFHTMIKAQKIILWALAGSGMHVLLPAIFEISVGKQSPAVCLVVCCPDAGGKAGAFSCLQEQGNLHGRPEGVGEVGMGGREGVKLGREGAIDQRG